MDPRLLSQAAWRDAPEEVDLLLRRIAEAGTSANVATLARAFLASATGAWPADPAGAHAACILVLGNALNADATATPELVRRLQSALLAHSVNPAARIITSGDGETLGRKESVLMKDWLVERGVPDDLIIPEMRSQDTVQNMEFSTEILLAEGLPSVIVLTGPHHIERAYRLLTAHLAQHNHPIIATPGIRRAEGNWAPLERFLFFKDLGRILHLWGYQDARPSPSTSHAQSALYFQRAFLVSECELSQVEPVLEKVQLQSGQFPR